MIYDFQFIRVHPRSSAVSTIFDLCGGFQDFIVADLIRCFGIEVEHLEYVPKLPFSALAVFDGLNDPGRSIIGPALAPWLNVF